MKNFTLNANKKNFRVNSLSLDRKFLFNQKIHQNIEKTRVEFHLNALIAFNQSFVLRLERFKASPMSIKSNRRKNISTRFAIN